MIWYPELNCLRLVTDKPKKQVLASFQLFFSTLYIPVYEAPEVEIPTMLHQRLLLLEELRFSNGLDWLNKQSMKITSPQFQ